MNLIQTTTLNVHGMSCRSCVNHVGEALRALTGVRDVKVLLDDEKVIVDHDAKGPSSAAMIEAIEGAGYEAALA